MTSTGRRGWRPRSSGSAAGDRASAALWASRPWITRGGSRTGPAAATAGCARLPTLRSPFASGQRCDCRSNGTAGPPTSRGSTTDWDGVLRRDGPGLVLSGSGPRSSRPWPWPWPWHGCPRRGRAASPDAETVDLALGVPSPAVAEVQVDAGRGCCARYFPAQARLPADLVGASLGLLHGGTVVPQEDGQVRLDLRLASATLESVIFRP